VSSGRSYGPKNTVFRSVGKEWFSSSPGILPIPSQLTMSSPGQPLPEFPPATHGPGRQAPYVTVRQAIQGISPHDRLHIPRPFTAFPPDGRYIDLDRPFTGTIMAGSNPYLHEEERRPFTHRESARVQTFGDAHVLGEVYVQRQSLLLKRSLLTRSWECGACVTRTESF